MNYGGGLVGGDQINLLVDISPSAILVLRSQGSTKVFKPRIGQRHAVASIVCPELNSPPAPQDQPSLTVQNMSVSIAAGGGLFLLPEPVTCFRSASYDQKQTFDLSNNASLVLLDWFTSGRMSMGEEWSFSRYCSANEIRINGKQVVKDVTLLEEQKISTRSRPLAARLAPYSCYAMMILFGPLVQGLISKLTSQYKKISVFRSKGPTDLLWSLSTLAENGAVIRVAGMEVEMVRRWLGVSLSSIEDIIGADIYRSVFQ